MWRDDYDGEEVRVFDVSQERRFANGTVLKAARSGRGEVGIATSFKLLDDGTPSSPTWKLVDIVTDKAYQSASKPVETANTQPVVKVGQVEPFELVSDGRPIAEYAATPNECAIRDRIQEIERRLAKLEARSSRSSPTRRRSGRLRRWRW